MNDHESLLRIAEKACIFDRAHFDDDTAPTPSSILSKHEHLPEDRKLITRLRSRHAVALGFYEGYVQAVVDRAGTTEQVNIGIVVKPPPPPPPPVAPPMPSDFTTPANEVQNSEREQYEQTIGLQNKTIEDRNARIRELEAKLASVEIEHSRSIELARTSSMPNDREIADLICRTIYAARNFSEHEIEHVVDAMNCDLEELRRKILKYTGSTAEACAVKFALLSFATRQLVDSSSSKFTIDLDGLAVEIDGELVLAAAEYANDINNLSAGPWDADAVKQALVDDIEDRLPWQHAVVNFIIGAQWQIARSENVPGENPPNVCETPRSPLGGRKYVEATARQGAEHHDVTSLPTPIVFRDENERDFWDEQARAIDRKGDLTSQDIASVADKMVEERRKRMPTIAANRFAEIVQEKPCSLINETELLREATKFAREEIGTGEGLDDLDLARSAVSLPFSHVDKWTARVWGLMVRAYANGAIRKSRKV